MMNMTIELTLSTGGALETRDYQLDGNARLLDAAGFNDTSVLVLTNDSPDVYASVYAASDRENPKTGKYAVSLKLGPGTELIICPCIGDLLPVLAQIATIVAGAQPGGAESGNNYGVSWE